MIDKVNDKGIDNLCNAIITQAVKDYATCFMGDHLEGSKYSPEYHMKECEEFFHSAEFAAMTDIDPDYLIREIKKRELKKAIDAYSEILNGCRKHSIRLFAPVMKGKKATKNYSAREPKPAVTYFLPGRLKLGVEQTMRIQLKNLQREYDTLMGGQDNGDNV